MGHGMPTNITKLVATVDDFGALLELAAQVRFAGVEQGEGIGRSRDEDLRAPARHATLPTHSSRLSLSPSGRAEVWVGHGRKHAPRRRNLLVCSKRRMTWTRSSARAAGSSMPPNFI